MVTWVMVYSAHDSLIFEDTKHLHHLVDTGAISSIIKPERCRESLFLLPQCPLCRLSVTFPGKGNGNPLQYSATEQLTHTHTRCYFWAFHVALAVKNPPADARDIGDTGPIPGSGRSPGEGDGTPFQYSCLENPTDRGARRATVHGAAKSRTQVSSCYF